MSIHRRHNIVLIVVAALFATSIFGLLQVAKGARFHQYNFLHVKYNAVFADQLERLVDRAPTGRELALIRKEIVDIRAQPEACLAEITLLDRLVMRMIGTEPVIQLCEKDLREADIALERLEQYEQGALTLDAFRAEMIQARDNFQENSSDFEKPVETTVNFIIAMMIGTVALVAVIALALIHYMSRATLSSIQKATTRMDDMSSGDADLTLRIAVDS